MSIWSLVPLPDFSKSSLYMWKFSVHVLLKPCLKNFKHNLARMWNEHDFSYQMYKVWTFFGIAFLWDWNENGPFPVLWPLLSFPSLWHMKCSTFTASSFRILNGSAGILSPPLALFVVMVLSPTWLRVPGCLALGKWWHHRGYPGHEDLYYTVLLCILAISS